MDTIAANMTGSSNANTLGAIPVATANAAIA